MINHASHNHPATSAARAICRRNGPAAAAAASGKDAASTTKKAKKGTPTLDDRIRANKKRPRPSPVTTYFVDPETGDRVDPFAR